MGYEWPQAGSPELHNFLEPLQIECLELSPPFQSWIHLQTCLPFRTAFCGGYRLRYASSHRCFNSPAFASLTAGLNQDPASEQKTTSRIHIYPFTHSCIHPRRVDSSSVQPVPCSRGGEVGWELFDGVTAQDPGVSGCCFFATTLPTEETQEARAEEN